MGMGQRRMPAVFIGHGNPMHAITENVWATAWHELGATIPKPRGIVSISAHWFIRETAVTAMEKPGTIHDFGGFPRELFAVEYPAPGDPKLAAEVCELITEAAECRMSEDWGLDHGTWAVLRHMFPDAEVPVVQLSIDRTRSGRDHFDIGTALRPLREDGVLILGSGNVVHNLHAASWGNDEVHPWAVSFEERVRRAITDREFQPLIEYEDFGNEGRLAIPTPDHYLPLLYVLGVARADDDVEFPTGGIDLGSVSMLSVVFTNS